MPHSDEVVQGASWPPVPYAVEQAGVGALDPTAALNPVTTRHAMRAEGKVFKRTLERVDALLTLQAMRGLNAEYQLGRHDPAQIATQFLEGNGILPPARYAPVPTTTTAVTSTST